MNILKHIFVLVVMLFFSANFVLANDIVAQEVNRVDILKSLTQDDRREFIRIPLKSSKYPFQILLNGYAIPNVVDISRGGIGINSKMFTKGEKLPVTIKYKHLDINTEIEIVAINSDRVGARFVALDLDTLNKLMYLSVLLESDNGYLLTRLSS